MSPALEDLARLYGVQTAYDDVTGVRREADSESLLSVLPILGAPVAKLDDIPDALRARRQQLWRRRVEPVCLAWDGGPAAIDLRLPSTEARDSLECRLLLEDGGERHWTLHFDELKAIEETTVEGVAYVSKRLTLPERAPRGYHRLFIELPQGRAETQLIAAPTRAYWPDDGGLSWGVFLPLYSLHSARSWGAGDFGDLKAVVDWARDLGGGLVGTPPLLAAFLDEPYEFSPYSPVSRLFWNEFYLDVEAVPEVAASPTAQAMIGSAEFAREIDALRSAPLVDYRRQMRLKRRVLEEAARLFFAASSERRAAFEHYAAEHSHLEDYAAFRAVGERLRTPWMQWPTPLRDGTITAADYDESTKRYHLYVQWIADEQLKAVSDAARAAGLGLYLDLPLGVDARGYDVWRESSTFAVGVAGGAPPDPTFPTGQNWGFVPLHPEGVRESGYRYVRAFLRHQLRYAGVLRIDHMPSFHRVFWVPPGAGPAEGVYVRYPFEELYAVFSLESHRHRTLLVGEDLGTVPPEVQQAMARHDFHRMFVVEYELKPDPAAALPEAPAASLACVNTHDMPPFATFIEGNDVAERLAIGWIDEATAAAERQARREARESLLAFLRSKGFLEEGRDDPAAVHRAVLKFLRDGPARLLLVNLEDLWSETRPQNVPSTGDESPNWRRKARHSFEEFSRMPQVLDALRHVTRGFGAEGAGIS